MAKVFLGTNPNFQTKAFIVDGDTGSWTPDPDSYIDWHYKNERLLRLRSKHYHGGLDGWEFLEWLDLEDVSEIDKFIENPYEFSC
jgi:hypothetical protein